jgi:branched-chain amino acid transport system substrate-binding protein
MILRPRSLKRLAPLPLLVLGLAFSAASCAPREAIVVGFVASLSGMDYMLGVEGRNAALLFVDELNAAGGVGGRKLRLEVRDLASDDAASPLLARELVDAGAVAIVGFYSSSSALKALPVLDDCQVPAISPTSTAAELSGRDDCFFRTIMTSARDPLVLGARMRESGQSRILFIAAAYNKPYYETYLRGLEPLVGIAGPVLYGKLPEIDYGRIEELARDPGYDAVMIVASSLDSGTIAQKLAQRGLRKPLYLSGWAGNDDVITYGGAAVEGATLVHQVDIGLAKDSALAAKYRSVFGVEAGYAAIETWDSMLLLVEGLRAAKGDPRRLLPSLKGIRDFAGSLGPIGMDAMGDARRALYLKRIQGGRFIVTGSVD